MQLIHACTSILDQLEDVIGRISDDDFVRPCPTLGGVTIAQHLRHTIEFFLCLEEGYKSGIVNYDKRAHDEAIENDRTLALDSIDRIRQFVSGASNRNLVLEVGYERHSEDAVSIETNFFRELSYNIEHAVHHMAIMKIGVREVAGYIQIPPDFGIAVSTLRFTESSPRVS
jgi:uncharacterized damage-inducible protein DinB